jgi:hypothetical protein
MGCQVYANNMSIACKVADGKSIAAFPDVCFTPPLTPATPPGVPIPYPNTGMASDTTKGSKTVLIGGQEVMLKDKSVFKTSTGDEAGNTPKKGVVTSKIKGELNFVSWSMDVKFEGENVPRHLDLMGHNEACQPTNTAVWPYVDRASLTPSHPCHDSVLTEETACAGVTPHPGGGVDCPDSPTAPPKNLSCKQIRACALPKKRNDKAVCCHPDTTGDHLIESSCFTQEGMRDGLSRAVGPKTALSDKGIRVVGPGMPIPPTHESMVILERQWSENHPLSDFPNYDDEEAPTACTDLPNTHGKHDAMQNARDSIKKRYLGQRLSAKNGPLASWGPGEESWWTYDEAASAGVASHKAEYPQCDAGCTRSQLDKYHHEILGGDSIKENNSTPVRTYLPKKKKKK